MENQSESSLETLINSIVNNPFIDNNPDDWEKLLKLSNSSSQK